MKMSSLVYIICVSCASSVSANWGGYAGGSVATGAFRAVGTNQIEMQNEDLAIRLYRDRATVRVDYVLKNTGDAVDVTGGFPCLDVAPKGSKCSEIEDYQFTADGRQLPYRTENGDVASWKQVFDKDFVSIAEDSEEEEAKRTPRILWLSSTVHFEKGESKNIRIQYESLYEFSVSFVSFDGTWSDHHFRYLLSTARAWKGPIQKGKVTISAVTIDPGIVSIRPANRFESTPEGFVWEFTNLNPTLQDNIEVQLNDKFSTIFNYSAESDQDASWYTFEGNKYFFDFHGYVPKATSTKAGFPVTNIGDSKGETAWVAGRNGGLDESITLTLTKPLHVSELGIIPGYGKSKSVYFANNRVQELEVAVNGTHMVKATLPDEYLPFSMYSSRGYDWIDLGEYTGNARTITLTIEKVYPGSKYNDTCISEILLRKRLKEKPRVHGAR